MRLIRVVVVTNGWKRLGFIGRVATTKQDLKYVLDPRNAGKPLPSTGRAADPKDVPVTRTVEDDENKVAEPPLQATSKSFAQKPGQQMDGLRPDAAMPSLQDSAST